MDYHTPVLLSETLDSLEIHPESVYIDATLGHGGHTIEILARGGIVYGIDQDPQNLTLVTNRLNKNYPQLLDHFHPVHSNFGDIAKLQYHGQIPNNISGLIADLGLNSHQLKNEGRGFSFNDTASLDMRLDPAVQIETAENIVNTYSYDNLVNIFTRLSQETLAEPIVRQIIKHRQRTPIKNSATLSKIINDVYQQKHKITAINPSTKIFMALRIAVNQEYENLKKLLEFTTTLPSGTRVAIISFHSGEDRIIKLFLRNQLSKISQINQVAPTPSEVHNNRLSRSALLRSYRIN